MNLINKLREKGLRGLWGGVARRIGEPLNRSVYRRWSKKPVQENLILLESEGDFCDNAYALYDHMRQKGYLEEYEVCWLVDDPTNPRFRDLPNTRFLSKRTDRYNPELMKAMAQCRWFIYDHNCLYDYLSLPHRQEQTIAYLSHGAGYKASKGKPADFVPGFDILFATGQIPADILGTFWNYPVSQVDHAGYPRLDFFFKPEDPDRQRIRQLLELDRYSKVFVWMPTFRQSHNKALSEEYLQNETGLPLLGSRKDLEQLNALLILKVHHLQAQLPIFRETFQNIRILQDTQLAQMQVQLYQFIPETDCLITDYSSISVEYTLLDKPIIYTLDDYDAYAASRGFYPAEPKQYMAGHHIYTTEQLVQAIREICSGSDPYQQARNQTLPALFTYPDGNASQRILAKLGIKKHS